MKGVVFLGECQCTVKECPCPEPGPGQVLVRMKVAGICGSDLHVYRELSKEAAQEQGNRIPGHEPSGVVEEIGEGVKQVQVGDSVSVYHYLGCGHCQQCAQGYLQWCSQTRGYGGPVDGAHADCILADERNCIRIPEPLTFDDGAFIACAGGTAYSALKKMAPTISETVAVFGLGPVGLSGVLLAKAMGARAIGVDVVDERLELAQTLGADEVVHAGQEESSLAALRRLTKGEGVDAAIEASGSTQGRGSIIPSLRRGGRAVSLGVGSTEPVINPTSIIGSQLTLMGSFVLLLWMAWEWVGFLLDHKLSFEPAVTHRFTIEDADEAYRLAEGRKTGKVVFVWD